MYRLDTSRPIIVAIYGIFKAYKNSPVIQEHMINVPRIRNRRKINFILKFLRSFSKKIMVSYKFRTRFVCRHNYHRCEPSLVVSLSELLCVKLPHTHYAHCLDRISTAATYTAVALSTFTPLGLYHQLALQTELKPMFP